MTPLRRRRSISAMVALLTVAAWLIASNHCAIASLERPVKAEHACCHDEKSSHPAAPTGMQCCEAFNVPVPEHVTAPVGHFFELPIIRETGAVASIPACPESTVLANGAHGPPRALGFAELILGRSLLAHAPPAFVA